MSNPTTWVKCQKHLPEHPQDIEVTFCKSSHEISFAAIHHLVLVVHGLSAVLKLATRKQTFKRYFIE